MTGAVFRDTVRITGELDAGTLTVKNFFNGNKYITTKYKYKYKHIKNVLKYKYKYQVGLPHLWPSVAVLKYKLSAIKSQH